MDTVAALRRLFDGEKDSYRDIVLFNAGAALMVSGPGSGYAAGWWD